MITLLSHFLRIFLISSYGISLLGALLMPMYSMAQVLTKDQITSHFSAEGLSWPLTEDPLITGINLKSALEKINFKEEIVVGVIDTGINPFHPLLQNGLVNKDSKTATLKHFGEDFTASVGGTLPETPFDTNGHGSNVSSIIKSVCVRCKILPLKYYLRTATGAQNLAASTKALEKAVYDNHIKVINYSGGGNLPDPEERRLLKKLAERTGVILVAAAGNDGKNLDMKDAKTKTDYNYYPASYNYGNIFVVGAHGKAGPISSSNYGPTTVLISAPGEDILGAGPVQSDLLDNISFQKTLKRVPASNKIQAKNLVTKIQTFSDLILANIKLAAPEFSSQGASYLDQAAHSTVTLTGTSQATAFVTGTVALLMMSFPKLKTDDIRNVIVAGSNSHFLFKGLNVAGGTLNVYGAYLKAEELTNHIVIPEATKKKVYPKTLVPPKMQIKPTLAIVKKNKKNVVLYHQKIETSTSRAEVLPASVKTVPKAQTVQDELTLKSAQLKNGQLKSTQQKKY